MHADVYDKSYYTNIPEALAMLLVLVLVLIEVSAVMMTYI
jgi:hypothetical protein